MAVGRRRAPPNGTADHAAALRSALDAAAVPNAVPNLGGRKDDQGKLRYDLVPWDAVDEIVGVLTDGAVKYTDRNWEQGMSWGRVIGAAFRHLTRWSMGEDKDPETGRSHLAHLGCCVLFLLAYEKRGAGTDDRPGRP